VGKLLPHRRPRASAGQLSDEAVVAACATDDPAALTLLFRRYHDVVDRYLARLAGVDERDRDDLVQATFLAIGLAAANFQGTSSVKTWLLGIATNVARNHVRTEVRRRATRTQFEAIPGPVAMRPDDLAAHRQQLERLRDGLAELPGELREVFVLCVIEGTPGRDAAQALGITEGTLWRRLHEARTALRTTLETRRTP
jgi:RNA polymerase sigma-70 factor (ECF subfamily)